MTEMQTGEAPEDRAWQRVARFALAIEAELERALGDDEDTDEAAAGARRLAESMRYSLRTPGKRLRPLLLLAACEAVGTDAERFVRFAVGVEMIHAYSLIHDDLPAMDDDTLRRGQPTNHIVYGDGIAILAGDGLLTEAFVAMLDPVVEPRLQMEIVADIARAAGREGMVGGQAADLLAEGTPPDEAVLEAIHTRKTGALILASVRAGARLGKAGAEQLDALEQFARVYGLAFQIADDVKDEIAPAHLTGKHPRGDRRAGKMTYPGLLGIDAARRLCEQELERAIEMLAPLGAQAAPLERLARDSIAPAFAVDAA